MLGNYEQAAHHLAVPEEQEEQWQVPEELGRQVVVYLDEEARLVGYYLCLRHPFRYQLPESGRRGKSSRRLSRKRLNAICAVVGTCPKRETRARNVFS